MLGVGGAQLHGLGGRCDYWGFDETDLIITLDLISESALKRSACPLRITIAFFAGCELVAQVFAANGIGRLASSCVPGGASGGRSRPKNGVLILSGPGMPRRTSSLTLWLCLT